MSAYDSFRGTSIYATRFMDIVGDGSGSIDMHVNGAVIPVEFKVTATAKQVLLLERIIIYIKDTGAMDSGKYGNGLVLTNGIHLKVVRTDATEEVLTVQKPILINADWAAYCHDLSVHSFGLGDNVLTARWTFNKDGAAIKLAPGDSLVCVIADDLTALTGHKIRVGMTSTTLT